LSYAILHSDPAAGYASRGGKMNPSQPALIRAAIERMPEGARIVAATDNDPDGRKLAGEIEALVRDSGREDLTFQSHWPEREGSDWNDRLRVELARQGLGPLFG